MVSRKSLAEDGSKWLCVGPFSFHCGACFGILTCSRAAGAPEDAQDHCSPFLATRCGPELRLLCLYAWVTPSKQAMLPLTRIRFENTTPSRTPVFVSRRFCDHSRLGTSAIHPRISSRTRMCARRPCCRNSYALAGFAAALTLSLMNIFYIKLSCLVASRDGLSRSERVRTCSVTMGWLGVWTPGRSVYAKCQASTNAIMSNMFITHPMLRTCDLTKRL